MIITLIAFTALFICHAGCSSPANNVHQTPPDLIKNEQESTDLTCSHSIQNHEVMLWYKQSENKQLHFLGYLNQQFKYPEEELKDKIDLDGNGGSNGKLTIKNLRSNDSAVYFCAVKLGQQYNPAFFGSGTKLTVREKGRSAESPKVEILNVSSTEVCNKEAVTLVCLASKFYPDHVSVSWDMNGEEMGNVATDNAATRDDKYYSISSRLQIPYQTWTTGKTFTCTVKFFNGTGYENHPASIRGPVDSGRNEAATFVKSGKTTMLAYGMIIVKSVIYGIFIIVVIKKQDFRGK